MDGSPGVLLAALLAWSQPAVAQRAAVIARFDRPPAMDGTLADSEWTRATPFADFKTLHPRPGEEPSESTTVYVGYDRANLYIGVRSLDRSGDSLRASAATPDAAWRGDWIAFCLDPHNDGLDAEYFLVTPGGYAVTGVLGFDGGPVQNATHRWSSAVHRTAEGYTAELAIPLAQLPYRSSDTVVMAFKLARQIGRSGEEMDSPPIDPDRPHVAQFRPIMLTGIEPSVASFDRPLVDERAAFAAKASRLARIGDTTMDQRVEAWSDASVFDYLVFPARPLRPSATPFRYPRRLEDGSTAARLASAEYLRGRAIGDFAAFLARTRLLPRSRSRRHSSRHWSGSPSTGD
jgi:hypothetical protein